MDISKTYVGVKYFKCDKNGELEEILRVVNDKNPDSFRCKVEGSVNVRKISEKDLKENYTRLRPDGVIYFNIVDVGEIQDVIVMMYRDKDIEKSKSTPYIVCRQCITDLFANTINPDYNNLITGFAVSEESLPENVTMDTILACDNMIKTTIISVYMDDTLDNILALFKTRDYDNVLYNLFTDHIKYKYKENAKDYYTKTVVDGYNTSLYSLMRDNEFMYEFCRGYGIYPVTFEVTQAEIDNRKLRLSSKLAMSNITTRNIQDTFLVEFDKSIDLDKIERDYFILRDCKDKMYIVAYKYNGNIEIPVGDIESRENIEKMSKIPGYSNIPDITNLIQFNTNKYR